MQSELGVQTSGSSPFYTKQMALAAMKEVCDEQQFTTVADIGGGKGELSMLLAAIVRQVWLVDHSPPGDNDLPSNVTMVKADLNFPWPIPDSRIDFAFSLECIEHVENPRHFMREMRRIIRPGGYAFISTPNNHSWSSKLTFLLRGQHRFFQEASYPAHISALLRCDLERMAQECNLKLLGWSYSNQDTLPRVHWRYHLRGSAFSDVLGVLLRKLE
jgi:ubiquinone/menaquinone biosynthesis C-methylase UbiE